MELTNAELYENALRAADPLRGVHHHPHDKRWLLELTEGMPLGRRAEILTEYSEQWAKAYQVEPTTIRKEGAARFAANTWVRQLLRG